MALWSLLAVTTLLLGAGVYFKTGELFFFSLLGFLLLILTNHEI
jgi:hypothetical protein